MAVFENLKCLRCNEEMVYLGRRGITHSEGVLLSDRQWYYTFACPICTKVEYFLQSPIGIDFEADSRALIANHRSLDQGQLECLSCGQMIRPGEASCSACGWNWGQLSGEAVENRCADDGRWTDDEEAPSACLSCGQEIPIDLKACPHCGWSWEPGMDEVKEKPM